MNREEIFIGMCLPAAILMLIADVSSAENKIREASDAFAKAMIEMMK